MLVQEASSRNFTKQSSSLQHRQYTSPLYLIKRNSSNSSNNSNNSPSLVHLTRDPQFAKHTVISDGTLNHSFHPFVCAVVRADQHLRVRVLAVIHNEGDADNSDDTSALICTLDGAATGWLPFSSLIRVTPTLPTSSLRCFVDTASLLATDPVAASLLIGGSGNQQQHSSLFSAMNSTSLLQMQRQYSSPVNVPGGSSSGSGNDLFDVAATNTQLLSALFGGKKSKKSHDHAATTKAAAAPLFEFKLQRSSGTSNNSNNNSNANEILPLSLDEHNNNAPFLNIAPLSAASSQQQRALPLSSNIDIRHLVIFSGSDASTLGSGGSGFVVVGALRPSEDFHNQHDDEEDDGNAAIFSALVALRDRVESNEEALAFKHRKLHLNNDDNGDIMIFNNNKNNNVANHGQEQQQQQQVPSPTRARSCSPASPARSATSPASAGAVPMIHTTTTKLGSCIVAVKVVPLPAFASSKFEHLRREIVIHAAASKHPNFLPLFGVYPVYAASGSGSSMLNPQVMSQVPPLASHQYHMTNAAASSSSSTTTAVSDNNSQQQPRVIGVALVFEWCDGGSLETLMQSALVSHESGEIVAPLREFELAAVCEAVASGLSFLHNDLGCAHRDIKPSNVLLTSFGQILIADLGIAKQIVLSNSNSSNPGGSAMLDDTNRRSPTPPTAALSGGGHATLCGSPLFLAPEVFECMFLSSSNTSNINNSNNSSTSDVSDLRRADVYSFGVLLRTLLFRNATEEVPEESLRSAELDSETDALIHSSVSPATKRLISRMLNRVPAERPTCAEILQCEELVRKYKALPSHPVQTSSSASSSPQVYPCIMSLVAASQMSSYLADEVTSLAECVSISPERLRRCQQEQEEEHQQQKQSVQHDSQGATPQHLSVSEVLELQQQQQRRQQQEEDNSESHQHHSRNQPPHHATSISVQRTAVLVQHHHHQRSRSNSGQHQHHQRESSMLRDLLAEAGAPNGVAVSVVDIATRHHNNSNNNNSNNPIPAGTLPPMQPLRSVSSQRY